MFIVFHVQSPNVTLAGQLTDIFHKSHSVFFQYLYAPQLLFPITKHNTLSFLQESARKISPTLFRNNIMISYNNQWVNPPCPQGKYYLARTTTCLFSLWEQDLIILYVWQNHQTLSLNIRRCCPVIACASLRPGRVKYLLDGHLWVMSNRSLFKGFDVLK